MHVSKISHQTRFLHNKQQGPIEKEVIIKPAGQAFEISPPKPSFS